jgi:basic membrane protein A
MLFHVGKHEQEVISGMKNRYLILAVTLVLAVALVLGGCGGGDKKPAAPAAPEKMKVAFVYIGPVGDAGGPTLTSRAASI